MKDRLTVHRSREGRNPVPDARGLQSIKTILQGMINSDPMLGFLADSLGGPPARPAPPHDPINHCAPDELDEIIAEMQTGPGALRAETDAEIIKSFVRRSGPTSNDTAA